MTKKIQQFIVFYFSLYQNKTPRCNTTYTLHIDVCHHSIISSSSCAHTSYFRTKFIFSFWSCYDKFLMWTKPKKKKRSFCCCCSSTFDVLSSITILYPDAIQIRHITIKNKITKLDITIYRNLYEKCVAISLGTFYGTNVYVYINAFHCWIFCIPFVPFNQWGCVYSANCNQVLEVKKKLFFCNIKANLNTLVAFRLFIF